MARAVPIKVRLSKDDVNSVSLQKSLEILHMSVVMEVFQEGKYSEEQREVLLTTMQQKCSGCFSDDVSEGMGGNSYV